MHALIFADRIGQELEPLNERTCVALLPVVGKPVLEHTLEALVAAGVREAVVALSPFADEVRAVLGDGSRWGMRLDYVCELSATKNFRKNKHKQGGGQSSEDMD